MKFGQLYELMPTDAQITIINKSCGAVRHIKNWTILWKLKCKNISFNDISKKLPNYKDQNPWLQEVNSQSLIASIRSVEQSFKRFWDIVKKNKGKNRVKHKFKNTIKRDEFIKRNEVDVEWGVLPFIKGFPNFQNRLNLDAFSNQQDGNKSQNRIRINKNKAFLTIRKLKDIPIILHRPLLGVINTVVIKKTKSGRFFASIFQDDGKPEPKKKKLKTKDDIQGIDVGCRTLLTCSDGTEYQRERFTEKYAERLKILQRRLCIKRDKNKDYKNSKSYKKLQIQIARLYEKISFARKDKIHKTTTDVVNKQHQAYALEDLNVSGMLKNHKLASSISDASFYEIKRQITYKANRVGKTVIDIDRFFPSSKMCHYCGCINKDLGMEAQWECPNCNKLILRDHCAAKNLQREGARKVGL